LTLGEIRVAVKHHLGFGEVAMELKTRPEDPRPARHAARRDEIIHAAWEQAAVQGLAAITLTGVAAAVGLRQPSLYSYFSSKNALIDAMFAEAADGLLALVEKAAYPGDSPREAARLVARTVLEFGVSHPLQSQLIFQRTIPGYEPAPEAYAPALRTQEIYVRKLREAGVTNQPDVDIFTAFVAGLGIQQLSNEPGGKRWVSQLDTVLDMFFEHLDRRNVTGPGRNRRP
jgi:AcrR family transcriptional regulator